MIEDKSNKFQLFLSFQEKNPMLIDYIDNV